MALNQRTAPRLWISRLAIYENAEPTSLIRAISFKKGLNIVVGLEKENVALGGHSVGKTSLCRLIRYCLGEARFATKDQEAVIVQNFPQGWVAAELEIDGEGWRVARPFNRLQARNRASRNENVEGVVGTAFEGNEYLTYLEALQSLVPDGSGITWAELLPWLTRDQECSFKRMGEWRSSLSQSESPGLSQKEADTIMRCVLGIFRKEENELAGHVETLKKGLSSAKGNVEQATHTPQLEYTISQRQLYTRLGIAKPTRDIEPLEAEMAVEKKLTEINKAIEPFEKDLEALEADYIQFLTLKIGREAELAILRGDVSIKASLTAASKTGEREEIYLRVKSAVRDGKFCTYGKVPYAQCKDVQAHIKLREEGPKLTLQNFKTEAEYKKHCKELEELQAKEKQDAEAFANFENEIKSIEKDIKNIKSNINALYRNKDIITGQLNELKNCFAIASTPEANEELASAKDEFSRLSGELEASKTTLADIRKQREAGHADLEKAYDTLVKAVFGQETGGLVNFKENLEFHLTGDRPCGGPALKGLARVLADTAAMLSSQTGFNSHPGFLMHDGPKVFELDTPVQQLIEALAQKTPEDGGDDFAPFQYIVTITAKNDAGLAKFVCVELAPKPDSALLFGRRLSPVLEQNNLLDDALTQSEASN